MTIRKSRKASRAGSDLAANLMLAPMVAAMRLPLMAADTSGMGKETQRAIQEKSDAFAEGIVAAQMSLIDSAGSFWTDALSGKVPALWSGEAVERSLRAALVPAGKRVKANYRRLSPKG
ncbi:hypothetical protein GA830_15935 [Mesorhizobium sp. NBSH29]|uniref:hypothetical protein n=1 Tax=Mesorhizobium sp. NBSH29 TaxID=2654249 RepID=UPI0018965F4D|nr:hypothetical protein [Mesorhizobium sp. NBSH29]QPC88073.1 hypothetical protein GA830_15935 [Mesorhizobium sp. NBSH29]